MTTTDRLAHRVALVTGGASGIGKATAELIACAGATVVVADIQLPAAEKVAAAIVASGGRAKAVALDVADEAAWEHVTGQVLAEFHRLDIVVNNAGISFAKPVADMTLAEWRRVMAVNLDGVFLGTKFAIRAMKSGGSIINIASVSGIKPYATASAYGASKAAIRLFSKAAALECADARNGIRVNVVTPAGVKTPMWETMDFFRDLITRHGGTEQAFAAMAGGSGSGEFFSAEAVARTILYLASDESSHLTGAEIVLDRGHTG